MPSGDKPLRGAGRATTAELTAARPKPPLKKVMPEVWKLVKPRLGLISGSFLLMLVNRLCSFVLPVSAKYLINNVMYAGNMKVLPYIIGAVAGATFLQGITFVLVDAAALDGRAAADLRPADAGAAAYWPTASGVL